MFRKSKIKIVVVIMAVLTSLFVGTLLVISYTSSLKVYQNEQDMIQIYVEAYWENGNPVGTGQLPEGAPTNGESLDLSVSPQQTFYSVAFSPSGSVTAIDNEDSAKISDTYFIHMARNLMSAKHSTGKKGNWIYSIDTHNQTTLVTFLDNSVMDHTVSTWFRYTLVFGSLALLLLLLISWKLANSIVGPLEKSYQQQKQFLSDASHELKTPLAVMATNLELLEQETGSNPWLSNITFENRRMTELIRQMLDLAQTENLTLKMESLDFSHLVTGEVLPFESVAFEKGLTINTDRITDGILLTGNSEQLAHLVTILIDNAISHAFKDTSILVCLTETRGSITFSVQNQGPSLSVKDQESLFQRFYRSDSSRTQSDGHYGLGLAIAKAIVTAHHGSIQVHCQDSAVIFTVVLPKK